MDVITSKFMLPPSPVPTEKKYVYPWENTELAVLCQRLYILAAKTGYTGTLEEFKSCFGAYLETNEITPGDFPYEGQYEVTPLPLVEQILQTKNKTLARNIVVEPIPYAETSNLAGGYTAIIG